jgi:hypothetical protein
MIGIVIGIIKRKENYELTTWNSSIKWGQFKSQTDGNEHSLTQTRWWPCKPLSQ